MSLQVWLPLNGDLHNQGLSGLTVTNSGATVNDNGKIGKCYYFNGSGQYLQLSKSLTNLYAGDFSWAIWLKPTDATRGIIFSEYSSTGSSNVAFELLANRVIRVYWNGSPDWSPGIALTQDIWSHVAITRTGNTLKVYVNGKLKATKSNATLTNRTSSSYIRLGDDYRGGTSVSYMGYMNDARIYDHCLSPKEVEEIAKGLVLHYKLDDRFCESTTNLITTQDGVSNTCYNGAINKYNYGTNTDMYKTTGVFQGKFCTKIYMGTAGNAAYPYIYFDPFNAKGTEIQTISFYYYPTIQNTLIAYSYNGTYNFSYTANGNKASVTNASQITIPVNIGTWNYITITAQKYDTTNTSRGIGYVRIGSSSHTSTTTDYWLFADIQVENKDHATGYAGVGGSRISTTIYDSSGYQNNGTIIGNLACDNNSPRYSLATNFNGSNAAIKVNNNNWLSQGMEEITINLWVKASSWPASIKFFSCTESGGFNTESGSSGYWRFPVHVYTNAEKTTTAYKYDSKEIKISALSTTEWNMITCIYSATGTKTYINGQLHHTYNNTSYGIHFNTNARLFFGCEANTANPTTPYFNGSLSDIRIYNTVLTESQIRELYNTSALVDNTGNIYSRELVQV